MSTVLSIITINFNNAAGLAKTMQSVMAQTYKNIEYIVIDGGSADGSKALIEKHAASIADWVSEADSGIYHAMNKGIERSTGAHLLFLNSGDVLMNEDTIANCFPAKMTADIVYGSISSAGRIISYPAELDFTYFFRDSIPHPASFISRKVFEVSGRYNEGNKIVSDWEFFLKAIIKDNASYARIPDTITDYDPDGISASPAHSALQNKERVNVLIPYMEAHYKDLLAGFTGLENELNLYKNSRVISGIKKIINSKAYRRAKRKGRPS